MEADPDLIKEVHGLDIEELRAFEKRMMTHNRFAGRQGCASDVCCPGNWRPPRKPGMSRSADSRGGAAGARGAGPPGGTTGGTTAMALTPPRSPRGQAGTSRSPTLATSATVIRPSLGFSIIILSPFTLRGGPQILQVSQEGWRRKGQERLNWSSHGPRDAESRRLSCYVIASCFDTHLSICWVSCCCGVKKTVVLCYCLVF